MTTDQAARTRGPGFASAAELQPIIDAIATSLREGLRFTDKHVSVTIPATGQTLVVSVRTGTGGSQARPKGLDARQLQLVNGAIDEKISGPLSVSMLSSIAGLSRSHFSFAFRLSVGQTPHAHIVRLRLERAKQLMTSTSASLSEIASATGFSDQAHFSNHFRRTTGTTPTQWRKQASTISECGSS
jgi:AraC family transcriptional regulator